MKRFFKSIIFLTLLITCHNAAATHIIGGEITYRCIGNQQYRFQLSIYTECGSPIILEDIYYLKYFSESLNISLNNARSFQVNKVSEEEISFYCSSVQTNCNSGAYRGIKRLDYEGTVDLSEDGRATDWIFFWQKSARSEEITTLLSPENEDYYAEALLNNVDATCNNSPTFSSNPAITSCIGYATVFSNTAVDHEGDQLSFSLAPPQSNFNDEVVFQDGYDHENFIKHTGSIELDENSGDLFFTSSQEEIGVTDIVVEERRNGKVISRITRGIQATSLDCENENPVISDLIDHDTTAVSVCAGDTIDVKFSASDPDGQNLFMSFQSGRFTEFSVANNGGTAPVGHLIWNTQPQDSGVHLFTIRVDDGVCPEPGVTTKTFIMNVLSIPDFDLGDDINTNCDTPVEISANVTGGDGNFNYNWSNGATSQTTDLGPGKYFLTVTDGNECKGLDSISIFASVVPDFRVLKRCFGSPAKFADSTKTTGSNIISWNWDFGDGNSSTEQHPEHSYSAPGEYLVTMEVTDDDDPACKIEVQKPVVVCGDIDFDFVPVDTCSRTAVEFIINSEADDECDIDSVYFDYGDGTSGSSTSHIYAAGGEYIVKLSVTTLAGCEQEFSRKVTILESPVVEINNGSISYFDCDNPDVSLTTTTTPGDGGNITYYWNTGQTTPNLDINEPGTYQIIATDDNGCSDTDAFQLLYPVRADFHFDAFCELGDSLRFVHDVFHQSGIVSWEWNLGDNTTFNDSIPPPHRYAALGDYNVKLKITDENNCVDSISHVVYNTYLDANEFDVTPNDVTICVKDTVFGFGPSGDHIDQYFWDFKNGVAFASKDVHTFYSSTGSYDVELEVTYNTLAGVNAGCKKSFGEPVEVFPELNAEIQSTRICKDIAVEFGFERTAGDLSVPIVNSHWDFGDGKGSSDENSPSYTYDSTGLYTLTLNIEDQLGCRKKIQQIEKVERVSTPDFNNDLVCGNEPMSFTTNFRDTLENITHYRWTFDGEDTVEDVWPMPNLTMHTLGRGNEHEVQLTVWNEFSNCDRSTTKTINTLELPQVNFKVDTMCVNEIAYFRNTSTGTSPITGYQWLFHDGSTSEEVEPTKIYSSSGVFEVTLVGFNELNCTDSITKNVVVLPVPEAAFRTEDEFVEAFVPIQFINESSGDINSYFWNFGDGAGSAEENPIHTYDTIKVYWPELIVIAANGCTDTTVVRTDLNVHLDLPTAFSPNNDNKNDDLRLIHHGIKELYEFKIYNRWGQLVFDAKNDLNAVWDGTLNGARQDAGIYVAHVKAMGAYNISFNFKKNVTLLR